VKRQEFRGSWVKVPRSPGTVRARSTEFPSIILGHVLSREEESVHERKSFFQATLKLSQEYFFVLKNKNPSSQLLVENLVFAHSYEFWSKMNKGTLFVLFFIVLFGGGVAFTALVGDRTESIVPTSGTTAQALIPISLEVEEVTYELHVEPGSSVHDAMAKAQETSDLNFTGRQFAELGFFVEEINGVKQNPRAGKYWIYYINGRKAEVGISVYIVQENDIISWKYEDEE
tara:strand:+ start:1796 stop:2485 length:690 start_codon:yes stop_codon:yes gene_type:complete